MRAKLPLCLRNCSKFSKVNSSLRDRARAKRRSKAKSIPLSGACLRLAEWSILINAKLTMWTIVRKPTQMINPAGTSPPLIINGKINH